MKLPTVPERKVFVVQEFVRDLTEASELITRSNQSPPLRMIFSSDLLERYTPNSLIITEVSAFSVPNNLESVGTGLISRATYMGALVHLRTSPSHCAMQTC